MFIIPISSDPFFFIYKILKSDSLNYSLNLNQLEFLLIAISDSILAINQLFFTNESVKLIDWSFETDWFIAKIESLIVIWSNLNRLWGNEELRETSVRNLNVKSMKRLGSIEIPSFTGKVLDGLYPLFGAPAVDNPRLPDLEKIWSNLKARVVGWIDPWLSCGLHP